jgi:hypothetical protein
MAHRGHRVLFSMIFFAALPLAAQTADDRVSQLEKRLDALTQEVAQIRQEIDKLKGAPAADDLTKIDVAQPAPQPAPAPSLADVQTVNNVFNPAASKVFNPDTSVIGNFLGKAGQDNPYDPRSPFQARGDRGRVPSLHRPVREGETSSSPSAPRASRSRKATRSS